jgi:AcrR family transcriptional regulator
MGRRFIGIVTVENRAEKRIDGAKVTVISFALRHFIARGFDAVSMDEIARLTRIPRRSLFRYFETKEDIVLEAVNRTDGAFMRKLLGSPDGPKQPIARLEWVYLQLAAKADREGEGRRARTRLIFKTPALLRRIIEGMDVLQGQLSKLTIHGAASGPMSAFRHRAQTAAISAAYVIAARKWVDDDSRSMRAWAKIAFDSLRAGKRTR